MVAEKDHRDHNNGSWPPIGEPGPLLREGEGRSETPPPQTDEGQNRVATAPPDDETVADDSSASRTKSPLRIGGLIVVKPSVTPPRRFIGAGVFFRASKIC
ncbi:MAG: hypothetical protein HYV76_01920 [Candidatus Vogelbacteria bacterium]|nr:hypothetical protein [Candidatus Vogelbacteria bacterium]